MSRKRGARGVAGDGVRRQVPQDQIAPARQERRARVELDVEHVARRELLALAQAVADHAARAPDLVAAVAELAPACVPSTTRAFAVQMRPPGGSTMRGYSAASSQPFQPREPSAHDAGSRPSRPTRRGIEP